MALTRQQFQLTDAQMKAINRHIEARSRAGAAEGDSPEDPTISVHFDF